jgi:dolichol-phosphate mannosyltransferase
MIQFTRTIVEKLERWSGLPFKRLIKFGLVGGSGIIVNMGIFYLANEMAGITYKISSLFAYELSILNNYFWNNLWTWKDRVIEGSKKKQIRFLKYHLITGLSAVINYIILLTSVEVFGLNKYLGNLIGIFIGMGINFILNHFWTFRKQQN